MVIITRSEVSYQPNDNDRSHDQEIIIGTVVVTGSRLSGIYNIPPIDGTGLYKIVS